MLFHTFKDYGPDVKQNYFVMYNLLAGALRVYYFNEDYSGANNNFVSQNFSISAINKNITEISLTGISEGSYGEIYFDLMQHEYCVGEYLVYDWVGGKENGFIMVVTSRTNI